MARSVADPAADVQRLAQQLAEDEVLCGVIALANKHHAKRTWHTKPETYWLNGLTEEYFELHLALDGKHEHTPDVELEQIASCAINWLRFRKQHALAATPQDNAHKGGE